MTPTKTSKAKPPDPEEWSDLTSFVDGLYAEMDKLAKKAPASLVSDLATARVNRAIDDARKLMKDHDRYISEVATFVPAGENPEVRDVLVVLTEISQALKRLDQKFALLKKIRGW